MALTLQDDMDNIFLESGFEENVTYTPSGGVAKTIEAIVFREGMQNPAERRGRSIGRRENIEILISTDSTNGILTITEREDTVTLAPVIGDSTTKTYVVNEVVLSDEGAHRLKLK